MLSAHHSSGPAGFRAHGPSALKSAFRLPNAEWEKHSRRENDLKRINGKKDDLKCVAAVSWSECRGSTSTLLPLPRVIGASEAGQSQLSREMTDRMRSSLSELAAHRGGGWRTKNLHHHKSTMTATVSPLFLSLHLILPAFSLWFCFQSVVKHSASAVEGRREQESEITHTEGGTGGAEREKGRRGRGDGCSMQSF